MYAIIENGGKQYRITEGMKIRLERLPGGEESQVEIKEVLVIGDEAGTVIGRPYVEGARVSGKILNHGKAKKVVIFKYKRRKDYKKKNGHRQCYTEMLVDKIHLEAPHGA
jgi:large subunit ribosomal protein L21